MLSCHLLAASARALLALVAVAQCGNARSMVAQEGGATRASTSRWKLRDITEVSQQARTKDDPNFGVSWENHGIAVWSDAQGAELARGLWVHGTPWHGTFLFSFEESHNEQMQRLVGLQEWSHGFLVKSVVPAWCDSPDDDFMIVPHVTQRLAGASTIDRRLFNSEPVSMKALQETPLVDLAAKGRLKESFRLTELPTFAAARSLRIEVDGNSRGRLFVRKADGKAGYHTATKTTIAREGDIPPEMLEELWRLLEQTKLFSDVREFQQRGSDGTHFVFEAVRNESYYYRDYWSPDLQPVINAIMFCHRLAPELNPDPNE